MGENRPQLTVDKQLRRFMSEPVSIPKATMRGVGAKEHQGKSSVLQTGRLFVYIRESHPLSSAVYQDRHSHQ